MNSQPLVTVILPCYNAQLYVEEAVRSIIKQSYTNLEIIAIDDCSTDDTAKILVSLANEDSRIQFIQNEINLKLVATLNLGIELSTGKYIARMDADDIAHPDRLKYQIEVMERDSSIVICGAALISFTKDGNEAKRYFSLKNDEIKADALFNSPFVHPCVVLRKKTLTDFKLNFDENFEYAEDYHLWQRMLIHGKGINLPRFLLKYRILDTSQTARSNKNEMKRFETISAIQQIGLSQIDFISDEKEIKLQYLLSLSDKIAKIDFKEFDIAYIHSYFIKLKISFFQSSYCLNSSAMNALGKVYLKVIILNAKRLPIMDLCKLSFSKFTFYGIKTMILNIISYKIKYSL